MNSEPSFEESSNIFYTESNQLQDVIGATTKSEKLTVSEIVQTYYQVMKVSSISKLLKESFKWSTDPKHQELIHKIHDVQKQIVEEFELVEQHKWHKCQQIVLRVIHSVGHKRTWTRVPIQTYFTFLKV